jgi:acyl phosphate:glycerol-3-phosphate acyltransferase
MISIYRPGGSLLLSAMMVFSQAGQQEQGLARVAKKIDFPRQVLCHGGVFCNCICLHSKGVTMDIFFPVIGYLLGAIPFGLVIGKTVGVDVRREGSRNIGATNVNRVLGKRLGALTLLCDCLKGLLPMWLASHFLGNVQSEAIIAFTGVMAVVGHMFPVYLGFRGGKGVATGLGVFLFLSPPTIVACLAVFLLAVKFSGFVSVGSLLASALAPLWLFLFGASTPAIVAALAIAALIWIKHHENIGRLRRGEEKPWKKA